VSDWRDDPAARAENAHVFVDFIRELAKAVDHLTAQVEAMQIVLDRHGIPTAEVQQETRTAADSRRGTGLADWFDRPDPPVKVQ
jgi:hypothetical protein